MNSYELEQFQHTHTFGTDERHIGEQRTHWVVALTLVMMVIEIATGMVFGSMALLADGWHMATHAAALGITVFAYSYARRRAHDRRYTFGTGKVSTLGGFGSAVSLAVVAALVLVESLSRLVSPHAIRFDEAIGVAIVGLIVNLVSAWLLSAPGTMGHGHAHGGHSHGHEHRHTDASAHADAPSHAASSMSHRDHNLRGAYLHVLADALTSLLAIAALVVGKYFGWIWLDSLTGVLGAVLIARWSVGLLRDTSAVLLDAEVSDDLRRTIQHAIEVDSQDRVADLHVWRVGPRHLAAIVSVVTHHPREPADYKARLGRFPDLCHVTVEVNRCPPS